MPSVLRVKGFRFFFYSEEHPPAHIHVAKGGAKARIILIPEIDLDKNHGFKAQEIKQIIDISVDKYELLISKWNETFNK